MKIAQVVCVFPPYKAGMGNVARHFAEVLADRGHEVRVFTPDYGRVAPSDEDGFNFAVERLKPLLRSGNGAFVPQLMQKIKDYDIVHLHYPFFGGAETVWLAKVVLRQHFDLMVHYHMDAGGLSAPGNFLSLPSKIIMGSLFRKARMITCASIDYVEQSSIREIYRAQRGKFREIPFGVDIGRFSPAPDRRSDPAASAAAVQILFVGGLDRAHYFKGVEVLIRAAGMLRSKNWLLTVAGEGDLKSAYEDLAGSLGIADRVEFSGKPSDRELIALYRRSDLLVLPSISRNEAFGLVLLEAMACGLPVVASSLPGVRKVFDDGKQGFLAEPGNVIDLADKISMLLADDRKRKDMGAAARNLAETKYSFDIFRDNLLRIYER